MCVEMYELDQPMTLCNLIKKKVFGNNAALPEVQGHQQHDISIVFPCQLILFCRPTALRIWGPYAEYVQEP